MLLQYLYFRWCVLGHLSKHKEFNMNLFNRDNAVGYSFAARIAMVMLLAGYGLSLAAAVGLSAGVLSGGEVFAGAFSFVLIAFGAIFTAYEMAHLTGTRVSGQALVTREERSRG
jgi:hypothetical protein